MSDSTAWAIDPDRALPADPATRTIARELYNAVSNLPIVSMHGHVEAEVFVDNDFFGNPAELLVIPDHYLVRMLVSQGYSPAELGVAERNDRALAERDARLIWRR